MENEKNIFAPEIDPHHKKYQYCGDNMSFSSISFITTPLKAWNNPFPRVETRGY
jgi:hypothetical protein